MGGRKAHRLGPGLNPLEHLGDQLLQVQRFGQKTVHAGFPRRLLLLGQHAGGEGDDRQVGQAQFVANQPGGGQPIHHRHPHIHQHGVERLGAGLQELERLLPVGGQGGGCAFQVEGAFDHIPVHRAVVHHQQMHPRQTWPGRLLRRRYEPRDRFVHRRSRERQFKPERAALPDLALHADRSPHQFHQSFADRQPQPGAAKLPGDARIGLGEGREQPVQHLGRHADPGVSHREAQPHGGFSGHAHFDLDNHFPPLGELEGIAHQIDQHLLQPQGVAAQPPQRRRRRRDRELEALGLGGRPQQALEPGQQRRQGKGARFEAQLAGFDLGQVEDVVENGEQRLPGALDAADHVGLIRRQRFAVQHLGQAQHAVQRGADFVAHMRQKLALGPAGRFGRLPRLVEFLLIPLALGDVLNSADGEHGHASGIAGDLGALAHPSHFAAAPDAVLRNVSRAGYGCGPFRQHPRPIGLVDAGGKGIERGR